MHEQVVVGLADRRLVAKHGHQAEGGAGRGRSGDGCSGSRHGGEG
jgi:hypothetical protein